MYDPNYSYMLTTTDNPFNPFTEFDSWFMYDEPRYHTSEYIARLSTTDEDLYTDEENNVDLYNVYQEIVKNDFLNIYRIIQIKRKIE